MQKFRAGTLIDILNARLLCVVKVRVSTSVTMSYIMRADRPTTLGIRRAKQRCELA